MAADRVSGARKTIWRLMEQRPPPRVERNGRQRWSGLMARLYSALILGALSLLATYAGVGYFAVLVVALIFGMAWEWGRLIRRTDFDGVFWAQVTATSVAAAATAAGRPDVGLVAVTAGGGAAFYLHKTYRGDGQAWWSALGVWYAGLPAVSLIWLRGGDDVGFEAVLYLFVVVWTTDTAAYFSGRLIGGPKLAPWISPKKTWAGLAGGAAAAALAGGSYAVVSVGSAFSAVALLSLVLALVSQLGDLGESAVKRKFGAKDASSLIPGHGGVLDRLDGLVLAAVAAAAVALFRSPEHPARALLLWFW
jgi:phosphatidate cytidylyltransferase